MIRKPPADFQREPAAIRHFETLHSVAAGGAAVARAAGYYARGVFCWCLALLWGFAALAAGAFGGFPTLIGVGALAAGMAWIGMRMFARARECRRTFSSAPM